MKKSQKKAENQVREIVAKQESGKGGIVDMITQAYADSSQRRKDKEDSRQRVESDVKVRMQANKAHQREAKEAFINGAESTMGLTPQEYKRILESAAAKPLKENQEHYTGDIGNTEVFRIAETGNHRI